jgi:hypothetical protein
MALATAIGCGPAADEEWPGFVNQRIDEFEADPKKDPPGSIWRYRYKGLVVFYVPPYCCDVPGELYDSNGTLICSPDGGITGDGDGRCTDFFDVRADEYRVWTDSR